MMRGTPKTARIKKKKSASSEPDDPRQKARRGNGNTPAAHRATESVLALRTLGKNPNANIGFTIRVVALVSSGRISNDFLGIVLAPVLGFDDANVAVVVRHDDDVGKVRVAVLDADDGDGAIAPSSDSVEGVLETVPPLDGRAMTFFDFIEGAVLLVGSDSIGVLFGEPVDDRVNDVATIYGAAKRIHFPGQSGGARAGRTATHYGQETEEDGVTGEGSVARGRRALICAR